MQSQTFKKVVNAVLSVAILVLLVFFLYNAFDVEERWALHSAIRDIRMGRNLPQAQQELRDLNDRQWVLDALHEAVEEEGDGVMAKIHLLETLAAFKEQRAVRRAVDSGQLSTRRAAVWLQWGDPAVRDRAREVTLEWLRDENADSRHRAALLCAPNRLEIRESIPDLLAILDEAPKGNVDDNMLRQAISSLRAFEAEGLGPRLMAIVADPGQDDLVRGEALNAAASLEGTDRDVVRETALKVVTDPSATVALRVKMIGVLEKPMIANESTWNALEEVLLDEEAARGLDESRRVSHYIVQRTCLRALCSSAPLDRFRELLVDRRVYRHPYYALRVDVASAIGELQMKERIPLEILCEYLVDQDKDDSQLMIRQDAYLSFFILTGLAHGVEEKELFRRIPARLADPDRSREFLLRHLHHRPGISEAQVKAVKAIAGDLEKMKQIRQTYQSLIPELVKPAEPAGEKDDAGKEEPADEESGDEPSGD